jgi:hypothetical protein
MSGVISDPAPETDARGTFHPLKNRIGGKFPLYFFQLPALHIPHASSLYYRNSAIMKNLFNPSAFFQKKTTGNEDLRHPALTVITTGITGIVSAVLRIVIKSGTSLDILHWITHIRISVIRHIRDLSFREMSFCRSIPVVI